jgi:hypothetical protein
LGFACSQRGIINTSEFCFFSSILNAD